MTTPSTHTFSKTPVALALLAALAVGRAEAQSGNGWQDLGYGTGGSAGIPRLSATIPYAGQPLYLNISSAAPGSKVLYALGTERFANPFKVLCGQVVPVPLPLSLVAGISQRGEASMRLDLPLRFPVGVPLFAQGLVLDPGAKCGAAFSTALAGTTAAAPGTVTVLLPFSSVDLPSGRTFFLGSGGHIASGSNARDLVVARSSTSTETYSGSGSSNSDHYAYGVPIYSPVDGEIITSWCNYPQNPNPPANHPNFSQMTVAGNHVNILTDDDGHVMLLAHMQPDAWLRAVAQHSGAGTYPNDTSDRDGSWPREYIHYTNRIRVRKGDRIGTLGNSGNSSGPHVHQHVTPYLGDYTEGSLLPMRYKNAWVKYQGGNWQKLDGDSINQGPAWIHASPFLRRDTDEGGALGELDMTGSIVALSNSAGNLQIIPYLVNNDGMLTRGEVETHGAATQIRIVHPNSGSPDAMTALRDGNGNLKVIAWEISPAGQLQRKGDDTAGPVDLVRATPFPNGGGTITATRGANGDLKLIAWQLTGALNVVRKGDADAGPVDRMDVTTTSADFPGVVTASVGPAGDLAVISWRFGAASMDFTRKSTETAGAVTGKVRIARVPRSGRDLVVTALKTAAGNLKLIAWKVNADGSIARKGDADAGGYGLVDLVAGKDGHVISTITDGNGELRMIAWQVSASGEIDRVGTYGAGDADRIASSYITRNGREFLLTAVRDGAGDLRTISWESNLK